MRELGQTYLKQGQIEAAEKQLLAALKIEPGYWVNYQELGRLRKTRERLVGRSISMPLLSLIRVSWIRAY